jgi:hypothetical protein
MKTKPGTSRMRVDGFRPNNKGHTRALINCGHFKLNDSRDGLVHKTTELPHVPLKKHGITSAADDDDYLLEMILKGILDDQTNPFPNYATMDVKVDALVDFVLDRYDVADVERRIERFLMAVKSPTIEVAVAAGIEQPDTPSSSLAPWQATIEGAVLQEGLSSGQENVQQREYNQFAEHRLQVSAWWSLFVRPF